MVAVKAVGINLIQLELMQKLQGRPATEYVGRGLGLLVAVLLMAGCSEEFPPGFPEGRRLTETVLEERQRALQEGAIALGADPASQILFGDLHVHTTYSGDAFLMALPFFQGEGLYPPADACDFARYCSSLDFFALTDHAEFLTPAHWKSTKQSVRDCNVLAGDLSNPDLVAFSGWEWTQVRADRENHFGHHNVIFRDIDEDLLPTRPISARGYGESPQFKLPVVRPSLRTLLRPVLADPSPASLLPYLDFLRLASAAASMPLCPRSGTVRELPPDCMETAEEPAELLNKLRQWGFPAMVIPHGTSWGFYTPPGSTLDRKLEAGQYDPQIQRLFEVWSGHGGAEEYRSFRAVDYDEQGQALCPALVDGYTPCCWRAGQIIEERCEDPGSQACQDQVRLARQRYIQLGVAGHRVIPGATAEDWLDCGQCTDCFAPAFHYRPGNSAQYALALRNFEAPGRPRAFRYGFIASSDVHSARPGTGYKEYGRLRMTEAIGPSSPELAEAFSWQRQPPEPASLDPSTIKVENVLTNYFEVERQASYFMTGGLVAVHARGRGREDLWEAMHERRVYGTSGPRILLWFDLLEGVDALPMGSELEYREVPRFRVRAAGALRQLPGCPEHSHAGLSPERLARLCQGECYHPSRERHRISRIEVIRVQGQRFPGEDVATLVDDPWRVFSCDEQPQGCVVEFEDLEYPLLEREVSYYVRAIQEPTLAVNGDPLRCERDAEGRCIKTHICHGDWRTPATEDCLAPLEERAWSSPIYLLPGV